MTKESWKLWVDGKMISTALELVNRTRNLLAGLLKAENEIEKEHSVRLKSSSDKVEKNWTCEIHTWGFFDTVQCFCRVN